MNTITVEDGTTIYYKAWGPENAPPIVFHHRGWAARVGRAGLYPGSYAVFPAEMDLVVAFSACPQDILPINGRCGHTTEAHFMID